MASGEKPRAARKRDCLARSAASAGSCANLRSRTTEARASSLSARVCAASDGSCKPCWASSALMRKLPKRPVFPGVDARLDESLRRQELLRLQPVEHGLDLGMAGIRIRLRIRIHTGSLIRIRGGGGGRGTHSRVPAQLPPQLDAALVTLRQQLQGAALERQPGSWTRHCFSSAKNQSFTTLSLAGVSSIWAPGSSGMPISRRTLFSISMARSGFSFRKSRALSLPWPIFSPL